MQVSVTTTQGLERRLEVAVPGERVAGEVDQRLKRLARTARLKGFRPGKVPYAVVRQQFGIAGACRGRQRPDAEHLRRGCEPAEAAAGGRPAHRADRGGAGQRAALCGDLRGAAGGDAASRSMRIAVERPTAGVTDEDVDAMLESMRAQRPVFTRGAARPPQQGDRVTLDYRGPHRRQRVSRRQG